MKNNEKEIAYLDGTISFEDGLPLPFVHYPGHYGAFIGFSYKKNSPIYFCSCSYEAIKNYMQIRSRYENANYNNPQYSFILSSKEFPVAIVDQMLKKKFQSNEDVFNNLKFKDKICHECNGQLPLYRYCHEMYGGVFKQNYGWYVKKKSYELGIDNLWMNKIEEKIPDEIKVVLEDDLKNISNSGALEILQPKSEEAKQLQKRIRIQNRRIRNIIENEVRTNFGHKKVGEAWTSETILYYLVCELFPDCTIHRHYRPSWLEGLELDIFVEDIKLGIEYQGIQHFQPVKHWGGEDAYEKLKNRDHRKSLLCKTNRIKLIYFNYNEEVSKKIIKRKMDDLSKR